MTHFTIQFHSKSLTCFTNLNSLNSVIIYSRKHNIPTHFTNCAAYMFVVGVKRNICIVPFLDVQELHCRSSWKANVCMFLIISVRKFFFQRCKKLLSGGGLNDILKVACCLGLVKCCEIFHINWNFWKFIYFSAFRYFHQ